MQNIGAVNAGDQFYRYKMPRLQAKIEGRGNGIKTNVVNMVEIAKALARPPAYTTKFFGCELGAQSKFDEKSGTAIVNGAHDASKLSELLEAFIKRFVCCYACGNPETVVQITKQENIELQCKACGNISKVDMRHKLTTYILRNPIEKKGKDKKEKQLRRAEQEREAEGEAIDAEEKARRKAEKKKLKAEAEAAEEERKRKKKEKKEKKKREAENGGNPESPGGDKGSGSDDKSEGEDAGGDDDDDVEWFTDTSAAAAAARATEQLSAATSNMVTVGNLEAEEAERKEKEKAERKKKKKMIKSLREAIAHGDGRAVAEATAGLDVEGGFDAKLCVLLEAVCAAAEEGEPLAPHIAKAFSILSVVAKGAEAQKQLVCALEKLVGVTSPDNTKETALILKGFYDNDVVEEEVIFEWYDAADAASEVGVGAEAAAAVRKAAFPFVNWLREADEEDSSEDEDSD